jgi:hypothetical protein
MAQALAKIRISPGADPTVWTVQATMYDTVTQLFSTDTVAVPTDEVRRVDDLKNAMDTAFGAIDYTLAAPPAP